MTTVGTCSIQPRDKLFLLLVFREEEKLSLQQVPPLVCVLDILQATHTPTRVCSLDHNIFLK